MRSIALVLFTFVASVAGLSQAQEPPGRVGRIAYVQGAVSVYQDPDQGWERGHVNTPITSENSVWTEPGARAELRIAGSALRLDGATQLDVSRLDDAALDATVAQGTINVRVRYKQRSERFAISTPQASFTLDADGRYRVDADADNDESRLTVFTGSASMETSRGRVRVTAGTALVVYGASSEYVTERATQSEFDSWALVRDGEWRDSVSRRYVSSNMTGYEDLDAYGRWVAEPEYGNLWFPTRVPTGWAPYRNGHWSYVQPWGWTWIDDEPWGYAPSHYGRWVYVRERWAWDPGRHIDRPAWAPALVGWIGGSGWSVGVSSGSAPAIGWYPLSPSERYEPWYRTNASYVSRVNSAVQERAPRQWQGREEEWRRANRDRATTVVQRDTLLNRRPVQNSVVAVAPDILRRQQAVAPGQVQQVLPQHNELIRRRVEPSQAAAPAPAAPAPRPPARTPSQAAPVAAPQNNAMRPDFSRRVAPAALAPAPANQPPSQAARPASPFPGMRVETPSPAPAPVNPNPAARSGPNPAAPAGAARQRETQPSQQQQQVQERDARQAREAQQREAQQQQQRAAQQAQQAAQQREAQQRAAQQAQQAAQQRAAQQAQQAAQQRAAQQAQQAAQQHAAQQAQQAQQAAQQRDAQQRAAQQAQQAAQQAAQRAQQAAQEAQRAARGAPPPPQAQPPSGAAPANPAARVERDKEKAKEKEKEKEKEKDKDEKPR